MYYRRDGTRIPACDWVAAFEATRRSADWMVARTHLTPASHPDQRVLVSTVFLGLDHNWGDGPPLIFETMVFGDTTHDQYQRRYSTESQALDGHAETVALLRLELGATFENNDLEVQP